MGYFWEYEAAKGQIVISFLVRSHHSSILACSTQAKHHNSGILLNLSVKQTMSSELQVTVTTVSITAPPATDASTSDLEIPPY